ncbi:fungal-specific transcription factor domain-containing protein [Xylaria sp. FL1042]|nr:fungal-specific transcription factor domain-containing protein [Xylaria sp. FL1042]
MSDQDIHTPAYTGAGNTPRGRARLPSSRRRDKPQLSCHLCRKRKLKCNREQPCSSCTQRGLDMSCTYSSNTELSPSVDKGRVPSQPSRLQDRIQQLEDLVVDLMHKTCTATPASESQTAVSASPRSIVSKYLQDTRLGSEEISDDASDHGAVELGDTGASYVGSGHWAAILDGIAELKEHFDKEKTTQHAHLISDMPPSAISGPQLLSGCIMPPEIGEILASIPPRPMVDRLVSQYFNSFEDSPAIFHSGQFLEEYKRFWEEPSSTPCIWLGLLFAIMCLAAQFQKYSSDLGTTELSARTSIGSELETMIVTFRQRTVQCLVLGRYAKGGPYVVETLVLYFINEHFLCKDAEIDVWIVLSIIVQVAIHTGYHKDPKYFKGMSPFASEMRRRVWASIVELDLGISAQMGVPRLIKPSQVDTGEPRNLQDSDFSQASQFIPPARPETDLTPMLYRITKGRLMAVFGLIWDSVTDVKSHSYAGVMEIDAKLENAHKAIPSCLEWQSITYCITDTPRIIMQKLFLEGIYWRAKIVLHRKFLNRHYAYSKEACVNAAFKLLDYQTMLDRETQPFGQLYQDRWKVSSIVNHDFLLAASLLCSYLQKIRDPCFGFGDAVEFDKITTYLTRSREIWTRSSGASKEAQKAVQALNIVLRHHEAAPPTQSPRDDISFDLDTLAGYIDLYGYEKSHLPGTVLSPTFIDFSATDKLDPLFEEPAGGL